MPDDQQLLSRFAENRSEAAFGELVSRYVNLVYSTALRSHSFDAHLAQDVAQLVFPRISRAKRRRSRATSCSRVGCIARRFTRSRTNDAQRPASPLARTGGRSHAVALESETNTDWQAIRPALDEALDKLSQTDRDALLLRFFEQRSLAEIGSTLGTNEDAAGKRVKRALEKLLRDADAARNHYDRCGAFGGHFNTRCPSGTRWFGRHSDRQGAGGCRGDFRNHCHPI